MPSGVWGADRPREEKVPPVGVLCPGAGRWPFSLYELGCSQAAITKRPHVTVAQISLLTNELGACAKVLFPVCHKERGSDQVGSKQTLPRTGKRVIRYSLFGQTQANNMSHSRLLAP